MTFALEMRAGSGRQKDRFLGALAKKAEAILGYAAGIGCDPGHTGPEKIRRGDCSIWLAHRQAENLSTSVAAAQQSSTNHHAQGVRVPILDVCALCNRVGSSMFEKQNHEGQSHAIRFSDRGEASALRGS
jgi:hypothetical protein